MPSRADPTNFREVLSVAEVHHFTYGAFNPIAAFVLAFLGSFLGLLCTERARVARTRSRRNRWLMIAAFSIGGAAAWLMHVVAILGFDVPDSPVRYNLWLTVASLGFAVAGVGAGLMIAGHGPARPIKVAGAGILTAAGLLAMHYTGMAGMHVAGTVRNHLALVAASAVIAVAAGTAAMYFAGAARGPGRIAGAAAVMAAAVCGMHYTGMAALRVELDPLMLEPVQGIRPLLMVVPVILITAATLLGVAFSALQAMTEEEFTDGAGVSKRGVHAEQPWSLRQASMSALRGRTPGQRPSPRPIAVRQPATAGGAAPAPVSTAPLPRNAPAVPVTAAAGPGAED
jgi:NO-binding membrane sensor protein with MHYT domain